MLSVKFDTGIEDNARKIISFKHWMVTDGLPRGGFRRVVNLNQIDKIKNEAGEKS